MKTQHFSAVEGSGSKMFQDVPRCSKMFQVELCKNALEMLEINDHQLL